MRTDITTIVVDDEHLIETDVWLSLSEVCERCALTPQLLAELVGLGLVTPNIVEPDQWQFRVTEVLTIHQALRLRGELDLDWQGVAVAMDLMAQLRELRQQVDSLQQQLSVHQ
jgi:chaperone modulatory protein CbpM